MEQDTSTSSKSTKRPSILGGVTVDDTVFFQNQKGTNKVEDLLAADNEDESLRRYKEALLGSAAHGDLGDVSDPRKVILTQFVISFEPSQGMTDIVCNLDENGIKQLSTDGITMKEGAKFKFHISFRVQHEIVVGIKFVNAVSKLLFTETEELVIGSYPPSSTPFSFEFPKWDYNVAPSGMMYRGKYKVRNSFYCGGVLLVEFTYPLNIIK